MKRIFALICLALITIVSASAQKKEVLALTEELNALKTQNIELQTQIDQLTAIAESNKVLADQLKTMVAAYQALESSYKSNSEQVVAITTKIDELIASMQSDEEAEEPSDEATKPLYVLCGDIMDGLALVKDGLLYGYVNVKGEVVIAAQFEEARDFSEGMAAVKVDNKWGYIDTTGKFVIAAKYQEARSFGENQYNGMARVKTNNKWGIINKSGQFVVAATYDVINVHPGNSRGWWICWSGDDSYNVTTNGRLEEW
jgi:hypothetical protein